jgi:hypothetical protein
VYVGRRTEAKKKKKKIQINGVEAEQMRQLSKSLEMHISL